MELKFKFFKEGVQFNWGWCFLVLRRNFVEWYWFDGKVFRYEEKYNEVNFVNV